MYLNYTAAYFRFMRERNCSRNASCALHYFRIQIGAIDGGKIVQTEVY